MPSELYLPKMSDHMTQGTIVKWYFREGDAVRRGQVVLEIETDKAVGEIEAPEDGVLRGVRAGEGVVVAVGETIAFIAKADEHVPVLAPLGDAPVAEDVRPGEPPAPPVPTERPESAVTAPAPSDPGAIRATPVARRMAKELGVDLSLVKGTGPGGRIKDDDIQAYLSAQSNAAASPPPLPAIPEPSIVSPVPAAPRPGATTAPNGGEKVALSAIQLLTGQRMAESFKSVPHFYLQASVDMTRALALKATARERVLAETGERLSITAILVRVAAAALKRFPRVNASFDDGALQLHEQVNVGVAVSAEGGLVVPVIKEADQKSLAQITQQLKRYQAQGKDLRFGIDDLSSGTFTISNLGMYGVDTFSAIINPPQTAILAVGRIVKTPVGLPDDTIALRPMLALTLSVDHRALDGMQGAQFLAEVKALLEEPFFLL